ncbi:hypothetical protein HYC85_029811 [Camellia sinensis]|uniref:Uncharacterized protein n=1 Tax=Camellia sinensis TaxID=4442 RepID=A0A7J7FYX7_CAMSI|nr:hypothetical protein HYC85_029811 [Camellia sinensis]
MHFQASIEYIGSALELIASLMDMVQRRETLLSLNGILVISSVYTPGIKFPLIH